MAPGGIGINGTGRGPVRGSRALFSREAGGIYVTRATANLAANLWKSLGIRLGSVVTYGGYDMPDA